MSQLMPPIEYFLFPYTQLNANVNVILLHIYARSLCSVKSIRDDYPRIYEVRLCYRSVIMVDSRTLGFRMSSPDMMKQRLLRSNKWLEGLEHSILRPKLAIIWGDVEIVAGISTSTSDSNDILISNITLEAINEWTTLVILQVSRVYVR
jgi:hypothetical protein